MKLKFRQILSDGSFHYWGYLSKDTFVAPKKNASPHSDLFTGLYDENSDPIYRHDILADGDNYNSLVIWNQENNFEEGTGFSLLEFYPKGRYDRSHTMSAYTGASLKRGDLYHDRGFLMGGKYKLKKYFKTLSFDPQDLYIDL